MGLIVLHKATETLFPQGSWTGWFYCSYTKYNCYVTDGLASVTTMHSLCVCADSVHETFLESVFVLT